MACPCGGNCKCQKQADSFAADARVGQEILRQLGGRRFMMMVGAKQPIWDGERNELSMKIARNNLGANYFVIHHNARDLYDLRFESRRMNRRTYEMSVKVKAEFDDVYADQLEDVFENATGLYTRMAESFAAPAKWAGYCPRCNKWRTADMSRTASPISMNYKGRRLDEKHKGKIICGKYDRNGLIDVYGMGYRTGQNQRICGMPLKKRKNAEESKQVKKDSCCCGATLSNPCVCMYEDVMECSASEPMCPCYQKLTKSADEEKEEDGLDEVDRYYIDPNNPYWKILPQVKAIADIWDLDLIGFDPGWAFGLRNAHYTVQIPMPIMQNMLKTNITVQEYLARQKYGSKSNP